VSEKRIMNNETKDNDLKFVIPVLVNEFDDGFHQVILNEVKNLIILAHEILLPPRRDQDD